MTSVLTPTAETKPDAAAVATPTPAVVPEKGAEQKAVPATTPPSAKDGAVGKPADTPAEPVTPALPEKYDLKANGHEIDAETAAPFEAVLREVGVSGEAAQKLLDGGAPVFRALLSKQIDAQLAAWTDELHADPLFAGEKGKQNLAVAAKARDAVLAGNPALGKLLDLPDNGGAGLGNNLAVNKLFHWIGTRISEDRFVAADGQGPAAEKSLGEILRPGFK